MTAVPALNANEIQSRLVQHPGWKVVGGKLRREFVFKDFSEAFGVMTRIALAAEKMDHHPEWHNVYNRLTVELITHDAGSGISEKDFTLAQRIDQMTRATL